MRISETMTLPATPDQVARMLADPAFVTRCCEAMEGTDITVDVAGEPTGAFTVTSSRVQSTAQIPDSLRRFAGDGLTLRQTDSWQAPNPNGTRVATIAVEVVGLPVRFQGSMSLEPVAEGAAHSVDGDLKASIPLVGGQVEQAAAPAIQGALRTAHSVALDWLQQHPA